MEGIPWLGPNKSPNLIESHYLPKEYHAAYVVQFTNFTGVWSSPLMSVRTITDSARVHRALVQNTAGGTISAFVNCTLRMKGEILAVLMDYGNRVTCFLASPNFYDNELAYSLW